MDYEHSRLGGTREEASQPGRHWSHGTEDEYAWMAPVYDTATLPFLISARREICRIAIRHGCRNILDLCCGTGQQAMLFHQSGIRATGVDLSPSMIAVARKKSPSDIPYFIEDASHLSFPSESFDAAVISLSLHEMEEPMRASILDEVPRILTPRGILIVLDYIPPSTPSSRIAFAMVDLVETLVGARHHRNFLDFMRRGGAEGCLERHQMRILSAKARIWGTMGILTAVPNGSRSGGHP